MRLAILYYVIYPVYHSLQMHHQHGFLYTFRHSMHQTGLFSGCKTLRCSCPRDPFLQLPRGALISLLYEFSLKFLTAWKFVTSSVVGWGNNDLTLPSPGLSTEAEGMHAMHAE